MLASPDFSAAFENGNLVSYVWKGEEQLAGPLLPHLWRVPTDNDEGGGSASYAHRWRAGGSRCPEDGRRSRPPSNQWGGTACA